MEIPLILLILSAKFSWIPVLLIEVVVAAVLSRNPEQPVRADTRLYTRADS